MLSLLCAGPVKDMGSAEGTGQDFHPGNAQVSGADVILYITLQPDQMF